MVKTETTKEKDFVTRIQKEKAELVTKIMKLENFINSAKFYELDEENRFLLRLQLRTMQNYDDILLKRITVNS